MALKDIFKKPAVLIFTGVVGFVVTNILTAKATMKYVEKKKELPEDHKSTWQENVCLFAKCYYPVITAGIISAGLIIGGDKKYALDKNSLISLYRNFNEKYSREKEAVLKNIGAEDLLKVKEDIHKPVIEKMKKEPVSQGSILVNIACWKDDVFFETTMEELMDAEYRFEEELSKKEKVSLGKFIELLSHTPDLSSEQLGWNFEYLYDRCGQGWLDISEELVLEEDDSQYYIISFGVEPTVGFDEF